MTGWIIATYILGIATGGIATLGISLAAIAAHTDKKTAQTLQTHKDQKCQKPSSESQYAAPTSSPQRNASTGPNDTEKPAA